MWPLKYDNKYGQYLVGFNKSSLSDLLHESLKLLLFRTLFLNTERNSITNYDKLASFLRKVDKFEVVYG